MIRLSRTARRALFYADETIPLFFSAKPKGSIYLLVKLGDTAARLCTAVLSLNIYNNIN